MPVTYTPIRYPGGKSKLYPTVRRIIEKNDLLSCTYAEAFAGGAGVAMKLLLKGDVARVLINDLDRAVYCIWKAIVEQPEQMCSFIDASGPTIDEWYAHRETYQNQNEASDLDLAKAAFFLNRT
ncbi:DNA adenine methylase, partial [Adlercreutzia sp.]|uniref:DNA adenine methylase n=1 Tax=Adlercreutzia sp. TaxID=1872387 RepID=UPI002F951707